MSKVLTIDDDRITHRFVRRALEPDFELVEAMNGEEGIELASAHTPDIILLDVEMPGLNGYEVCDQLRHIKQFETTPIVFLSSHSSLRERMQGYDSGGTDYLTKPFEPDTLRAKLRVLSEYHGEHRKLQVQAKEAEKTAYSAISTSSELGQVVHFAENVAAFTTLNEIGNAIIKTAVGMGLKSVVSIRGGDEEHWYATGNGNGSVSPLEQQVMSLLRQENRINDFGSRTVVNYPLVSIMVKNMPLNDMERYGRIKDILPAILTTANSKIEALNSQAALDSQTIDITRTLENAHRILSSLIEQGYAYRKQVDEKLYEMFDELQSKLPHMGLEEDQEMYIINRIDHSIMEVTAIEEKAGEVNANVDNVISDIDALVDRQKLVLSNQAVQQPGQELNDDDDVQSVELF